MLYLGTVGGDLAGLEVSCSHDVNRFGWVLKDCFKTSLELEVEWKAEVRDGGRKVLKEGAVMDNEKEGSKR